MAISSNPLGSTRKSEQAEVGSVFQDILEVLMLREGKTDLPLQAFFVVWADVAGTITMGFESLPFSLFGEEQPAILCCAPSDPSPAYLNICVNCHPRHLCGS